MLTKEDAVEILKTVKDPELDIDVWTLGLIYEINTKDNTVDILMTFTTPFCPYGPQLLDLVKLSLKTRGFKKPNVKLTFNPPWQPSPEVKELLGMPS